MMSCCHKIYMKAEVITFVAHCTKNRGALSVYLKRQKMRARSQYND